MSPRPLLIPEKFTPRPCRRRTAQKTHGHRHGVRVTLLLLGLGAVAPLARGESPDVDYQTFLDKKTPALVTVKFVLRIGGTTDREREQEATGIMIGPIGLVLCSNAHLGGLAARWSRWGAGGAGASVTPTELKVLVGDDTEGVDAEFIARDSELDLAWVRIKEPGQQPFAYIDFADAVTPKIGRRIVLVQRAGKYFARAPVVAEGRIGGVTTKPRDLFILTGAVSSLGVPVFDTEGNVLGVTITQIPDPEESTGRFSGTPGVLLLPAARVAKATTRALEAADQP
jgi:hypothetical protein